MHNRNKGNIGEDRAVAYLQSQGFHVLERNFRTSIGEIDIIARRGEAIHFIEVKYRRGVLFGYGAESVGYHKQKKIHQVATVYLGERLYKVPISFDVVDIMGEEVRHLVGCF